MAKPLFTQRFIHYKPFTLAGKNPKPAQIEKTVFSSSGYHHNDFESTCALGFMMYDYTLLVPLNQRVLNNPGKERNTSGHKSSITHSAQISQKQDGHNIYAIIKTVCPHSLRNSGSKYICIKCRGNFTIFQFASAVCCKDSEEIFVYYVGNGFIGNGLRFCQGK